MGNEVLQEYRKKVVILLLAIVLLSATAAAVVLPGMTVLGFYPSVKMGTIIFFIGAVIVEDIIGAYLIKRSLQYDVLPESYGGGVKIFLLLLLIIKIGRAHV